MAAADPEVSGAPPAPFRPARIPLDGPRTAGVRYGVRDLEGDPPSMLARLRPPDRAMSLAFRLYILLAAIVLPAFTIYYMYTLRIADAFREQELATLFRVNALRVEALLAPLAIDQLSEPERDGLRGELGRMLAETNGIESVWIYHADGHSFRIVAGGGSLQPSLSSLSDAVSSNQPVNSEIQRGNERYRAVSVPLHHRDRVCGAIHMEVSPKKLESRVPDLQAGLVIGAAGLMLLVGLGLAYFFHHSVARPVHDLMEAMRRASEGNLSALVDISGGEFGRLSSAYNQMMRRLKTSVDENQRLFLQVQDFNQELRRKVNAATEELATKNLQLQEVNEKLFLLQRQMTMLEKLATLGEVATTIAHELGTPLNAISGHLQLLMQDGNDPKMLERLRVVDGQVERLVGIIRDVLKAMRVPPPRLGPIGINSVIEDVVQLISPVVQKRNIVMDLQLSRDLPLISADSDQVEQVLMNLFTNAMDAMKTGGTLRIRSTYVASAEAPGLSAQLETRLSESPYVRIDVADTGVGMDRETARKIFEPFFTTKGGEAGSPSAIPTGVGLGLSICRQILRNHHGEVAIDSEPGKGATFTLFLPVERERALVA